MVFSWLLVSLTLFLFFRNLLNCKRNGGVLCVLGFSRFPHADLLIGALVSLFLRRNRDVHVLLRADEPVH